MKNPVQEKSFQFALAIINFCKTVYFGSRLFQPIIHQLIRSGTSIGANIEEADAAQTKKDFLTKMHIAFKEAKESNYWLRIFLKTNLGNHRQVALLLKESDELIKLLSSITKSTKKNLGG